MGRLIIIVVLLLSVFRGQAQLVADAGPDKTLCNQSDTPTLGGSIVAQGGVPPYRFTWIIRDTVAVGSSYVVTQAYMILNHPDSANPKVKYFYMKDSLLAVLKVTDNMNNVAFDTLTIYFFHGKSLMWTPMTFKSPADTVKIGKNQTSTTHFTGFHDFKWTPGKYLDDSTTRYPRCFSPVSMWYFLTCTNRIGCRMALSNEDVVVTPVGFNETSLIPDKGLVVLKDNKLVVNTGTLRLPVQFEVYDLSGKRLIASRLIKENNEIELPQVFSLGVYVYSLSGPDGTLLKGRLGFK